METRIEPEWWYDDNGIYASLGISSTAITRCRLDGSLRHTRIGKSIFYLGQWIIDWLIAYEAGGK